LLAALAARTGGLVTTHRKAAQHARPEPPLSAHLTAVGASPIRLPACFSRQNDWSAYSLSEGVHIRLVQQLRPRARHASCHSECARAFPRA
jgi:hypothetical protein